MPSTDVASFAAHLSKSKRIVALLGAGLSASSGLPTFRGAGGYWRNYDATILASPNAFRNDPGLVWQFYSYRRHMALNAKPNPAHYAIAELARRVPGFLTLSQNVDNLSPRAGHPAEQLKLLHGNLFDIKCWDENGCGYTRANDYTDPIVPALAIPENQAAIDAMLQSTGKEPGLPFGHPSLLKHIAAKASSLATPTPPATPVATEQNSSGEVSANQSNVIGANPTTTTPQLPSHPLIRGLDISNASIPVLSPDRSLLPHCPACKTQLLRPGIVWFGEELPKAIIADVDAYLSSTEPIDLMLVIGTSSKVYPAAGYTHIAKKKGARVAVINMDAGDARHLDGDDWFFEGDAAVLVPMLLEGVIGKVGGEVEKMEESAGS